jgi:hypothetical protein
MIISVLIDAGSLYKMIKAMIYFSKATKRYLREKIGEMNDIF